MRRPIPKRWIALGAAGLGLTALYLANASWMARPTGELALLAHRGVHQPFSREGLTSQSCTAAKSLPVEHRFIENTLPSIAAAFGYGADMVEIDVHPTTDGEFAVFHDWTLGCRTNGKGVTREHSMAELKALDVGYGYTRDGGRTFPLRGSGVGMMPTLAEVLAAFPGRRFVINIKSNDPAEADLLHAYLPSDRRRLVVMGGWRPVERLRALDPALKAVSKSDAKACLKGYVLTGWYGHVPAACRNSLVMAPSDLGWLLWGWPDRFLGRMQRHGAEVFIGGRTDFELQTIEGFDDPAAIHTLPKGWRGGVMTDRVELIGPALKNAGR
ncbi:MAG TPA: glycerophosphodiester phosphodiesterase family protein [Caulobacteraceae bacterium]|nr:glycerophosphodiester phosphodiesterase family protein [Caulobacteraceae bacterium]